MEKSGLYYPNKMARIYLTAIEEMIGAEAMAVVLKQANLAHLMGNYPPNNFVKEFDFAEFSAVGAALEKMYGLRGERGLGLHSGKACFQYGMEELGATEGAGEFLLKNVPFETKLKVALKAMARSFSTFSDQRTRVEEDGEKFIYTIEACPVCWGRTSSRPICYVAVGVIQAGLRRLTDEIEFDVEEVACHATGAEHCVFHIRQLPQVGG